MRIDLTFEAIGYRDAAGRFAKRTKETVVRRREMVREAARALLSALKARAPKRTGTFAQGLSYRTYETGTATQARFYATGAHAFVLPFLTEGTRPHPLPKGGSPAQLAKGYPLRFFWEKGPRGPGIYRYWSVHHPGTDPDPFIQQASSDASHQVHATVQQAARTLAWL